MSFTSYQARWPAKLRAIARAGIAIGQPDVIADPAANRVLITAPTELMGVAADRHGNVVANPVFSDLNPNDQTTHIRGSSLVYVAGIVGVPWQDIARRNAGGQPDLLATDVPEVDKLLIEVTQVIAV